MNVEFSPSEAAYLRDALTSYLSDLRYEIADTDRSTFREQLREKRAALESALEKLQADDTVSA